MYSRSLPLEGVHSCDTVSTDERNVWRSCASMHSIHRTSRAGVVDGVLTDSCSYLVGGPLAVAIRSSIHILPYLELRWLLLVIRTYAGGR